jgi:hypothetical protein
MVTRRLGGRDGAGAHGARAGGECAHGAGGGQAMRWRRSPASAPPGGAPLEQLRQRLRVGHMPGLHPRAACLVHPAAHEAQCCSGWALISSSTPSPAATRHPSSRSKCAPRRPFTRRPLGCARMCTRGCHRAFTTRAVWRCGENPNEACGETSTTSRRSTVSSSRSSEPSGWMSPSAPLSTVSVRRRACAWMVGVGAVCWACARGIRARAAGDAARRAGDAARRAGDAARRAGDAARRAGVVRMRRSSGGDAGMSVGERRTMNDLLLATAGAVGRSHLIYGRRRAGALRRPGAVDHS